jgi:hypothetical protein
MIAQEKSYVSQFIDEPSKPTGQQKSLDGVGTEDKAGDIVDFHCPISLANARTA